MTKRFLPLWLALLAVVAASAAETPKKAPKPPPKPDVLVVADSFKEFRDVARPAPGHPIYYVLLKVQEYTIGSSTANEPMPTPQEFERLVESALASQGYIRTQVGGPVPSIAIIAAWGEAKLETWEYQDDSQSADSDAGPTTVTGSFNSRQMLQLAGANKPGAQTVSLAEADAIREAIVEDRLHLFIGALDFESLRHKKKKLVWRVRMSIPSLRNSLPEAMSLMLTSAGPYFGREMDAPVVVDDALRRKAEVEIGAAQVIEFDAKTPAKKP